MVQQVAPNLWLLAGESGNEALYAMEPADRARVHLRLSELYEAFDAVIVDAARASRAWCGSARWAPPGCSSSPRPSPPRSPMPTRS